MQSMVVILITFLSTLSLRRATRQNYECFKWIKNFYPRSPCGERRGSGVGSWPRVIFLSTLSLRRATFFWLRLGTRVSDFYPRSPCGERLHYDNYNLHCVEISIHALLAESDEPATRRHNKNNVFLSTLSLRRATQAKAFKVSALSISIHALLAESDGGSGVGSWPRVIFLSTLSLRRATLGQFQRVLLVGHFYPRSPCGERPEAINPS